MSNESAEASEFGELERVGDLSVLRYRRHFSHPREKVWRALTEDEHLMAWFPTAIEGDRIAGAPLRFSFRASEGEPFDGAMHVFDPPSCMELRWGEDVLRFELTAEGADETALELAVTVSEFGKTARDGAGWHVCLDRLDCVVSASEPPWTPSDRWREVHRVYVGHLGPDASAIGPPQEWEQANPPGDQ